MDISHFAQYQYIHSIQIYSFNADVYLFYVDICIQCKYIYSIQILFAIILGLARKLLRILAGETQAVRASLV